MRVFLRESSASIPHFIRICLGIIFTFTLLACSDSAQIPEALPEAEFLLASGDSTYWVRSSAEGLRVRSAPLLLTRSEDSFYELRIIRESTLFYDVGFVTEQLYGYSLMTEDSVLLFSDESVARTLENWLIKNPGEELMDENDEESVDPTFSASDYLEVVDVHSHMASWSHSLDIDLADIDSDTHNRRRGVVDIRNGNQVLLDSILSSTEAQRVSDEGKRRFDAIVTSVGDATDERAIKARETLHSFVFDKSSFSLTDIDRMPAISFYVSGRTVSGESLTIMLPPIKLNEVPYWWKDVSSTLPEWAIDSLNLRWSSGDYVVSGKADSSRTRLTLFLSRDEPGARLWPLVEVPMPAYQFLALDSSSVDRANRLALLNAFERATEEDPFLTKAFFESTRKKPFTLLRQIQNNERKIFTNGIGKFTHFQ